MSQAVDAAVQPYSLRCWQRVLGLTITASMTVHLCTIDEVKGQLYFSKSRYHRVLKSAADPELFLIYVRRDQGSHHQYSSSKADVYYSSFERWQRYETAGPVLTHPRCL